MAKVDAVRRSFARLIAAGYVMPRDIEASAMLTEWLKALTFTSDKALESAIDQYLAADNQFWPKPGVIASKNREVEYYRPLEETERVPMSSEDFRRILRENGYDYEEERREGLIRLERSKLEESP